MLCWIGGRRRQGFARRSPINNSMARLTHERRRGPRPPQRRGWHFFLRAILVVIVAVGMIAYYVVLIR